MSDERERTDDLWAAAGIMAEATSYFVLPMYGEEGLRALLDAGWTVTPPTTSAPAAWQVIDVMAGAITDDAFHPDDRDDWEANTDEDWEQAKAWFLDSMRDDAARSLAAIERGGWIAVDWDAERPDHDPETVTGGPVS